MGIFVSICSSFEAGAKTILEGMQSYSQGGARRTVAMALVRGASTVVARSICRELCYEEEREAGADQKAQA